MIICNEEAYEYRKNPNYFITRSGKIYSIYKIGGHGSVDMNNPHLLKYGTDDDGYYKVVLSIDGNKKYIKVHTVVVEQFIGDIPEGMVVNHKDGDKTNNNLENLEIVTVSENTIHAHKSGLVHRDIKIVVIYDNKEYKFNSIKECISTFPDISIHYLNQLRNKTITPSMILFVKRNPELNHGTIDLYYNGSIYKSYDSMKEAEIDLNMKKGSVSSAIKNNEYRKKINNYIITFPDVSTIETSGDSEKE